MQSLAKDPMSKHWCFTLNNYTDVEYAGLLSAPHDYVIIGKEVGENGTPHLQGYIVFLNRKRLAGCKKLSPRAHWEIKSRYSTIESCRKYCMKGIQSKAEWNEYKDNHGGGWLGPNWGKEANFIEDGVCPLEPHMVGGQATKDKWAEALASAKVNMLDDIQPKMLVQNYQTFKRIAQDYQQVPPDLNDVCGEWFYGEPRTGKSRAARDLYPGAYDKPCNKWWDGYRNHPFVIIDDFDKNHEVLGHHLKRWADRYSFPAEHKGHTYQIRPQKIIVTSNYHPEEIFQKDPILAQAILERFRLTHFTQSPFNRYCSEYNKQRKLSIGKQKRKVEEMILEEEEKRNVKKKIVIDLVSNSSDADSSSLSSSSEESSDSIEELSDESPNSQEDFSYAQEKVPDTPPLSPRRGSKKVVYPEYANELFSQRHDDK